MANVINATSTGNGGLITTGDDSGVLNIQTNETTAVTVDASQNVGIGTSSPSSILQLNAATPIQTFNQTTANSNQGVQFKVAGTAYGQILNNATTGIMDIRNGLSAGAGYVITFSTDGSERARIDSSGNLLVGTTTYAGSFSGYRIHVKGTSAGIGITATANGDYGIGFNNASNSLVGNITINSSTTAYNTSSDYRLKNTIVPMTGALARVAALKPCTYKWNVDDAEGEGFIAHELAEVVPDAVTGEKDAVETYTDAEGNEQTRPKYQGIDTSFLVATLTAAIQEQQALITTLTERITALEGAQA